MCEATFFLLNATIVFICHYCGVKPNLQCSYSALCSVLFFVFCLLFFFSFLLTVLLTIVFLIVCFLTVWNLSTFISSNKKWRNRIRDKKARDKENDKKQQNTKQKIYSRLDFIGITFITITYNVTYTFSLCMQWQYTYVVLNYRNNFVGKRRHRKMPSNDDNDPTDIIPSICE